MDDEGRPLSGTPPFRFSSVLSGEPAAIVDAIRRRDPQLVQALVVSHVEGVERRQVATEDVGALLGLAQPELRAADDDVDLVV
ncbi:hypothetical protein IAE22_28155, partial [Bacillus sp. S34]|nr:hypothetical protein [Bacillus sp. S34]